MPELPELKWKPAPPGRKERLARWFAEWNLLQRMRRADPALFEPLHPPAHSDVGPSSGRHRLVAPFNTELKVGQIRSMAPGLFAEFQRFSYVALIGEWGGDAFVTAPFGPFLEPATKTEWLTGREEHALRVLQLWNARTWPREVLERSWLVDELTAQEREDAWTVFLHAATGATLSDRLLAQVGCPVVHPRDPRLAYQKQEASLFALRSGEQAESVGDEPDDKIITVPEFILVTDWNRPWLQDQQLALAANSASARSGAPREQRLSAPELRLTLLLREESNGQFVSVTVRDQTQQFSTRLNGAVIRANSGEVLATVAGWQARLPIQKMLDGIRLFSASGQPIKLDRMP